MDHNLNTFSAKIIFGIKSKFSFIIALFLVLIFGSAAFVLVQNSNDNLTKQVTAEAKAYTNLSNKPIIESYKLYYDSGYLKFREILSSLLALNTNISYVLIYDANGVPLVDSRKLPVEKLTLQNKQADRSIATAVQDSKPLFISHKNGQINEIIYPHEDNWGSRSFVVKYFVSYDQVLTSANKIKTNIVLIAAISLIISFVVISWLIGRIILNPIKIVHQGALLISQGKFDHEIEVKTHDEVGQLATAVNTMAKSLQKNIESLQQVDKLKDEFITIATHHLRTPITAIKGYLSFLGRGRLGTLTEEQSKCVKVITQSTNTLSYLVEDLLSIVHFETGNTGLIRIPANLVTISEDVIKNYNEEAAKKGVNLSLIKPQETLPQLKLDQQRISEVVRNLVDNAIKFSKSGGQVIISFEIKNRYLITNVKDNGIGISPEEMKNLFQKFHRGTDILKYEYPGEGLSLYIDKLIIRAHKGEIWASSELGKGSIFSFSIPVSADQKQNTTA